MIIWRGLGVLALIITGAAVLLVMGALSALLGSEPSASVTQAGVGTGLVVAGVANVLFGRWVNIQRAQVKAERIRNELRAELQDRVAAGTFQVAPGAAAPSSPQEARLQVEQVVHQQAGSVAQHLRNNHTLFFIPVQWVGVLEGIGGVVLVLMSPFAS